MGALDSTEWELFLRKMIARNLRIFGAPDPVRKVCRVDFFCKPPNTRSLKIELSRQVARTELKGLESGTWPR